MNSTASTKQKKHTGHGRLHFYLNTLHDRVSEVVTGPVLDYKELSELNEELDKRINRMHQISHKERLARPLSKQSLVAQFVNALLKHAMDTAPQKVSNYTPRTYEATLMLNTLKEYKWDVQDKISTIEKAGRDREAAKNDSAEQQRLFTDIAETCRPHTPKFYLQ